MPKPDSYFSHVRADILRLVPADCRAVLSVGCGEGATEAVLVARGASVVGVEQSPGAAASARAKGIEVFEADAEVPPPWAADRRFDCLIYADVLEHLRNPEEVLRRHVEQLKSGGTVIISVPNFRNYMVAVGLFLGGEVRYTQAGILDKTHVRLTTRKMVQRWMSEQGLNLVSADFNISRRRERYMSIMTGHLLREFVASQVIVVGRRP